MRVETVLDSIDNGAIALPEFQRGYVWNRNQVRSLMTSLYRGHPVGGLLTWQTQTLGAPARGDTAGLQPGTIELLLDGQQRVTTLYGIVRGTPPPFFDGNSRAFTNLKFHLEEEKFEFWQPVKMGDDWRWIDVSDLMERGAGSLIGEIYSRASTDQELLSQAEVWSGRLNRIDQIKQREFHIEKVTGADKTVDVVVDIFNQVNSGGTKLSKGDLALAKVCAGWSEGREQMQALLRHWHNAGYEFSLEWLLRCVNAVATGRSQFLYMDDTSPEEIREALEKTEKAVDKLLNAISSRLGLDHARVLKGVFAFPVMVRYLVDRDLRFADARERDRLLYWYLSSAMWGRFASSTESVLAQDLLAITDENVADPVEALVANLATQRGDLVVRPGSFKAWSTGARFYPVLYALTRSEGALDWGTGDRLDQHALGRGTDLHLHHIFPKARLYEAGYERSQVNSLANLTFMTQETNLRISDRDPAEYIPEYMTSQPGAAESHWIPTDPDLFAITRYEEFLERRQELLAEATNHLLEGLWQGNEGTLSEETDRDLVSVPITSDRGEPIEDEPATEEAVLIDELQKDLVAMGYDPGERDFELIDETSNQLAVLDVAWPKGLQQELSEPVALLIDEPDHVATAASEAGFKVIVSADRLRSYAAGLGLADDDESARGVVGSRGVVAQAGA